MGKFQPGHRKPVGSGRKKGTPNRKTTSLEEALLARGLDLPGQIVATIKELNPEAKARLLIDLMPFLFPKRKSIEQDIHLHQAEIEKPIGRQETFARLAHLSKVEGHCESDKDVAAAHFKLADHYERLSKMTDAEINERSD